ncbi:divalent-cation tolerance protein CutA [Actinoplanes rectilineatus]|uniref:divalent-cation tolerance protein CutA n=1 Tax=Actinoplanes rectilineatus TaxID=113571 RepID=UPI0005F2996B|nr:divalent-cation tolerance protein CutA [Actinoplanes rectilineatus]
MGSDSTDIIQVSTATGTEQGALELARLAVKSRLAAGAQVVGPVKSVFWHAGESGEGVEWQLILRTTADRYDELEKLLIEHHPWTNPEVLGLRVAAGSGGYLDWVRRTVQDSEHED